MSYGIYWIRRCCDGREVVDLVDIYGSHEFSMYVFQISIFLMRADLSSVSRPNNASSPLKMSVTKDSSIVARSKRLLGFGPVRRVSMTPLGTLHECKVMHSVCDIGKGRREF